MYCTAQDIEDQLTTDTLKSLTDDEDTGLVVGSRVETAIADACAEIDGYLGRRYAVPLTVTPPVLRPIAVSLAAYQLAARRADIAGAVADRRKAALEFLAAVADGTISLGAGDPAPTKSGTPEIDAARRVFNRLSLGGF